MPSFADLKAKAARTASGGVEKLQNVKDRNTSVAMKKTNWDPYSGNGPPAPPPPKSLVNQRTKPEKPPLLPPPRRTGSNSSSPSLSSASHSASASPAPPLPSRAPSSGPPPPPPRATPSAPTLPPPSRTNLPITRSTSSPLSGPPPILRSSRPDLHVRPSHSAPQAAEEQDLEFDWTKISQEDKEAFFSWLDEYFSKHLNISIAPRGTSNSRYKSNLGGPPPLRAATKPTSWTHPVVGNTANFILSHPPVTIHGCAALDLAHFFSPNTHWTTAWYNASGAASLPPPLIGNSGLRYGSAWNSRGSLKTTQIGVAFSDLSVFWGAVTFSMDSPENPKHIKREGYYLPRPKALDMQALVEAHDTYGDTIALFAESFLGTGQYCARGECWDLASESLKYFDGFDYIPKPVPSISRTHGHLIYEGKADKEGQGMVGRWRGGDDRIRRGDIVEWRKVKIATISIHSRSYSTLGDPDHTAVIVNETVPNVPLSDGSSVKPSELGVLTVVEQSVGQPPERKEYNLQGLQEGEMWIYRPISMQAYLGIVDFTASVPEHLPGLLQLT